MSHRPPECRNPVEFVLALIQERYANRGLSLEMLSTQLELSARHLSRLFKRETGKTFQQHLREVRMREAADLLGSTGFAVKEIANMVGYDHGGRFCQHFRDAFGCTPAAFRDAGVSPITGTGSISMATNVSSMSNSGY